MDYTTLARVRTALGSSETAADAQLSAIITAASRVIDRHLSGAVLSDDYLKQESVSGETLTGLVDKDGRILCHAHKPVVTAVTAAAYRLSPLEGWLSVDTAEQVTCEGYAVTLWTALAGVRGKVFVQLSYTGGLAASTASLPADILDAADVLSVRLYREVKTGLQDSIGVAELGTLMYTKAFPIRVTKMLEPHKRVVPW